MKKPVSATASAPTKLILFGEHFVVYGAPGLAVPASPRNRVETKMVDGKPGLLMKSDMGEIFFTPGGEASGDKTLSMFGAPYTYLIDKEIVSTAVSLEAVVTRERKSKGMGNSSSIGASLGISIAGAAGKKLGKKDVFECAQRVDEIAHGGGRPSGIDARTVVEGRPQIFRKVFDPPSFDFHRADFGLPDGFAFVVVDTYVGKKAGTGELIRAFASSVGAKKPPKDMTRAEREAVCSPYVDIYERAARLLANRREEGILRIGGLMNENHELLLERGVSTSGIERARGACLDSGALGAKLSGAGGEGGVVLVLCRDEKREKIISTVEGIGFAAFQVSIATRGAVLESAAYL